MRPELFRIFDVSFPAYFVLLLTGFSFATAIAVLWARRIGQNPDVIVDLSLACLLMGVVGGRIFHVLFDGFFWDYVHLCTDPALVDWKISEALCHSDRYRGVWDSAKGVCHPGEADCWAWAKFWAGGLTYYGGLAFASVAGIWLLIRDRFPVWKGCDLASVGIATGLGFGRIGCLLAGCCFGQPHGSSFSLAFPPRSPASEAQFKLGDLPSAATWSNPVLPTQALEGLMSFAVAGVLILYVQSRKRYDGQVFVWFLALYAVGRFILEFFRADDRGGMLGLSTSQWVGVAIIAAAIWLHHWRKKTIFAGTT
ncbi:MAG: prolipoprotein diacylglyceryl transferase [Deltaproteobacteria bacterium]|nr:prolipoprotein diacylglyceryl transferase [Deltaproteobacteria bacterium]